MPAASNVATIETRPSWAKGLDDREYAWVIAYMVHFNARKAAEEAGVPVRSAHNWGSQCRQRPHVREAIDGAMKERMPALKLTLAERLAAIVTTDIGEIVDWGTERVNLTEGEFDKDGKPLPKRFGRLFSIKVRDLRQLTPAQRASIKSVKKRVTQFGTNFDVVMHDPINAADRLAALLELIKPEQASHGGVTFIIEAPDGTQMRDVTARPQAIDHDAIAAAVAKNKDSTPDELPPGTKLVIEGP